MRQQMLRLFGAGNTALFGDLEAGVFPPMNITQDNDNFYVRAEVPGISPKDLETSAMGLSVSISGKREIAKEDNRVSYHRKERAEGEFSRTVTLPAEFDTARVDATYKAGILTVTLPKAETAKPRQIVVNT